MTEELTSNMEKVIITSLFESLYRINKITKKEYSRLIKEMNLILT